MQFFSQNPVFKKEYQNHGIVICQTGAKFTGSPYLSGWRDLGLQQESLTQWVKMKILPIQKRQGRYPYYHEGSQTRL